MRFRVERETCRLADSRLAYWGSADDVKRRLRSLERAVVPVEERVKESADNWELLKKMGGRR